MKINIFFIVREHWRTLYNARSKKPRWNDFIVFYGLPVFGAAIAYRFGFAPKNDPYNVSITFFGIFLALLLNIQVAIFGIFQRKWESFTDKRQSDRQKVSLVDRRILLTELNTNISYLTIMSCLALVCFLIFYVYDMKTGYAPAVAVALYIHFILTFLMVVKRSHALFQREYKGNNGM